MRPAWWLPLLPARARDRYGDELADLLERSHRPGRDVIDLLAQAVIWNVEEAMEKRWFASAAIVAALSIFWLGRSTALLAGGIGELPRHWWSSASLLGLLVAAGLALAGRRAGTGPRDRD